MVEMAIDFSKTFTRLFHHVEYAVTLRGDDKSLTARVEQTDDHHVWQATFSAEFLEEITRRTGNFKTFPVFTKMMLTAITNCSGEHPLGEGGSGVVELGGGSSSSGAGAASASSVYLDLLTSRDLDMLRQRADREGSGAGGARGSSASSSSAGPASNHKRYLILTYAGEFDRVHYPLALVADETIQDPEHMRATIKQLKEQLLTLKRSTTMHDHSSSLNTNAILNSTLLSDRKSHAASTQSQHRVMGSPPSDAADLQGGGSGNLNERSLHESHKFRRLEQELQQVRYSCDELQLENDRLRHAVLVAEQAVRDRPPSAAVVGAPTTDQIRQLKQQLSRQQQEQHDMRQRLLAEHRKETETLKKELVFAKNQAKRLDATVKRLQTSNDELRRAQLQLRKNYKGSGVGAIGGVGGHYTSNASSFGGGAYSSSNASARGLSPGRGSNYGQTPNRSRAASRASSVCSRDASPNRPRSALHRGAGGAGCNVPARGGPGSHRSLSPSVRGRMSPNLGGMNVTSGGSSASSSRPTRPPLNNYNRPPSIGRSGLGSRPSSANSARGRNGSANRDGNNYNPTTPNKHYVGMVHQQPTAGAFPHESTNLPTSSSTAVPVYQQNFLVSGAAADAHPHAPAAKQPLPPSVASNFGGGASSISECGSAAYDALPHSDMLDVSAVVHNNYATYDPEDINYNPYAGAGREGGGGHHPSSASSGRRNSFRNGNGNGNQGSSASNHGTSPMSYRRNEVLSGGGYAVAGINAGVGPPSRGRSPSQRDRSPNVGGHSPYLNNRPRSANNRAKDRSPATASTFSTRGGPRGPENAFGLPPAPADNPYARVADAARPGGGGGPMLNNANFIVKPMYHGTSASGNEPSPNGGRSGGGPSAGGPAATTTSSSPYHTSPGLLQKPTSFRTRGADSCSPSARQQSDVDARLNALQHFLRSNQTTATAAGN